MYEAVVLLSGGMDSSVCLFLAAAQIGPPQVQAVFFDWGQRAGAEEHQAARLICEAAGAAPPVTISIDFPYGGALTDPSHQLESGRSPGEISEGGIPRAYFPGRNLVMLAHAFGLAASSGARHVYFGANADDSAGFPDCRAGFLRGFEDACEAGLGRRITLRAPLIDMDKRQIVAQGEMLGVPWGSTFSCYSPVGGAHCGSCDACVLRQEALRPGP